MGNLFNQINESVNQIYKIGDESTAAAEKDKRVVCYDIVKLSTTETDERWGSLFTKKEALNFSKKNLKNRVEYILFALSKPDRTGTMQPFIFELHVSRKSCKKGLSWNNVLNNKIASIMVLVAEEAAKTNGVDVEFINDDFDATMVFKYH